MSSALRAAVAPLKILISTYGRLLRQKVSESRLVGEGYLSVLEDDSGKTALFTLHSTLTHELLFSAQLLVGVTQTKGTELGTLIMYNAKKKFTISFEDHSRTDQFARSLEQASQATKDKSAVFTLVPRRHLQDMALRVAAAEKELSTERDLRAKAEAELAMLRVDLERLQSSSRYPTAEAQIARANRTDEFNQRTASANLPVVALGADGSPRPPTTMTGGQTSPKFASASTPLLMKPHPPSVAARAIHPEAVVLRGMTHRASFMTGLSDIPSRPGGKTSSSSPLGARGGGSGSAGVYSPGGGSGIKTHKRKTSEPWRHSWESPRAVRTGSAPTPPRTSNASQLPVLAPSGLGQAHSASETISPRKIVIPQALLASSSTSPSLAPISVSISSSSSQPAALSHSTPTISPSVPVVVASGPLSHSLGQLQSKANQIISTKKSPRSSHDGRSKYSPPSISPPGGSPPSLFGSTPKRNTGPKVRVVLNAITGEEEIVAEGSATNDYITPTPFSPTKFRVVLNSDTGDEELVSEGTATREYLAPVKPQGVAPTPITSGRKLKVVTNKETGDEELVEEGAATGEYISSSAKYGPKQSHGSGKCEPTFLGHTPLSGSSSSVSSTGSGNALTNFFSGGPKRNSRHGTPVTEDRDAIVQSPNSVLERRYSMVMPRAVKLQHSPAGFLNFLLSAASVDPGTINTYLLCYRKWTNAPTLLSDLQRNYLSNALQSAAQHRVVHVLKRWLEEYFEDDFAPTPMMLSALKDFIHKTTSDGFRDLDIYLPQCGGLDLSGAPTASIIKQTGNGKVTKIAYGLSRRMNLNASCRPQREVNLTRKNIHFASAPATSSSSSSNFTSFPASANTTTALFRKQPSIVGWQEMVRSASRNQLAQQQLKEKDLEGKEKDLSLLPAVPLAPLVSFPLDRSNSGGKVSMDFLSVDLGALVKELCLVDQEFFRLLRPVELVVFSESTSTPTIKYQSENFNILSTWIASEIVSVPNLSKRIAVIKTVIRLGKKLKQARNFNSCMAVIAALNQHCVARLKATWKALPSKVTRTFEELENFMDIIHNFKAYREHLASCQVPLVPYFGMMLRDVTLLNVGVSDINEGVINMDKMTLIAAFCTTLARYQSSSYGYNSDQPMRSYIASLPQRRTSYGSRCFASKPPRPARNTDPEYTVPKQQPQQITSSIIVG